MKRFLYPLCAAVFLCAAAVPSFAQSATIAGQVSDTQGAVIPHAQVRILQEAQGTTRTTYTNGAGYYNAPFLVPGSYRIYVQAPNFSTVASNPLTLTVGQALIFNVRLKPGTAQQTVTVTAGSELLNKTSAEIGQVIDQHAIVDLPLNGRDPSTLVDLSVGVTNELFSHASTLPGSNSFPTESGASAGGQRQGSTWYLLDGVSNMDTFALLAAPFPNADATQEFRVVSNNFDARYGFAPSAVVNIETKSGSNQFHGGLFEFVRNNDLNAATWFPPHSVDPLKRNQFGGFLGGPIRKDRLFFFTNYQGTRDHYTSTSNSAYTPTQAMLNGDFSAVPAADLSGPLAASVFHTADGKPNQVDPSLFSPGALAIAKSLPVGGDPSTGLIYYTAPAQMQTYNENTSRLDATLTQNQRVFLRSFLYNYNQPGATIPGDIISGVNGQNGTYLNLVAGHTWTISPTLLNSARLSWQELDFSTGTIERTASGSPICLSKFIDVSDPANECYIGGLSAYDGNSLYGNGLGFNAFSGDPNDTRRRYWWFTDTLTRSLGKHTLVAGTDILHRYGFEFAGGAVNPSIALNGQYTGFPLADFLLGYASSLSQGAGESGSESGYMFGIYGQDQYRALRNLTVTLGLRWDPNIPLAISGGRGAAFVPGQQSTRYPNAPQDLVFPGDKGIGNGLMPTTYGYLEPRIGIAWQAHPNTVVRSGFGLFTTPLEDAFYNQVWDAAPFAPSFQLNGTETAPLSFDHPWSSFSATGGKSPFPPFASPTQVPGSGATFITPIHLPAVFATNLRLGVTQSWNLSVEQGFGKNFVLHLAYVGSESYHQATTVDQNPGHFFAAGSPQNGARTTYPNFSSIIEVQDGGTAGYNGLQTGVEMRLWHGLQFQSNFTWSHDTDVGGSGDPSFESSVSDPYNIRHDYGPSSLNYPVVSVSNFIYAFPSWRGGNPLLKNLLGGWMISGLYTGQSGPPFKVNGGKGNNRSYFDEGQDRADLVPGQPLAVRKGGEHHWLQQYFNTAAFTNNALGTPGNSKKFMIQTPPINTLDAAAIKNFALTERCNLQFRWEAFNTFNHPSFGQPDSNPGDANFGRITVGGLIPPRVMQGALKLTF